MTARLYMASSNGCSEQALARLARPYMPAEKAARCGTCKSGETRTTMLLCEALLAYAFADAYGFIPSPQLRTIGPHGKPMLAAPDGESGKALPSFNMSHSGEQAFVGVGDEPIGVDVERHRPIAPKMAQRFMDDEELAQWMGLGMPQEMFFERWTRRESELKWQGCGLSGLSREAPALPSGIASRNVPSPPEYSAAVCARNALEPYAAACRVSFEELEAVLSASRASTCTTNCNERRH